jgi:hypothetical protein
MDKDLKHEVNSPPTGFNWDNFDMDKFFKEADAVGKILEEKRKSFNE